MCSVNFCINFGVIQINKILGIACIPLTTSLIFSWGVIIPSATYSSLIQCLQISYGLVLLSAFIHWADKYCEWCPYKIPDFQLLLSYHHLLQRFTTHSTYLPYSLSFLPQQMVLSTSWKKYYGESKIKLCPPSPKKDQLPVSMHIFVSSLLPARERVPPPSKPAHYLSLGGQPFLSKPYGKA